MNWGYYTPGDIEACRPPSGYRTPFNISRAPLSLWVVDPAHRECVKTGKGTRHVASETCWYNVKVLESRMSGAIEKMP